MKINKITTAALMICIISLFGCIKKVEIDIPYDGDKIVLHSYLQPDSNVYAILEKSYRLDGTYGNREINNGVITLWENNAQVATLTNTIINGRNWYVSNYKTQANRTYTVKASAPSYTNVEGTETMVNKANFKIDSFYKTTDKYYVRITINDPTMENFYNLKLYYESPSGPFGTPFFYPLSFYIPNIVENESAFDQIDNAISYQAIKFPDSKFNGKSISLKLEVEDYYTNLTKVKVVLSNISKSYYRYIVSTENQDLNSGNPFTEPSQIFTNVKNGYGVVATYADSVLIKTR